MTTNLVQPRRALKFVVLLGVVSLFADVTYEGARSITGPYLEVLGASAVVVGVVAGLGEFVGYALRLVSGFITERTGHYWTITFLGYFINLVAVPLMGAVHQWQWVAVLMLLERLGKAIRTPARDAMLSHATSQTGHGWGFGLHEFLDQLGAVTGPLIIAWSLHTQSGYSSAFKILGISAVAALVVLFISFVLYPRPRELEVDATQLSSQGLPSRFWWYLTAAAFVALGYADFPLLAFHWQKAGIIPPATIPLLYSLAMASDGIAALLFGRLFDSWGLRALALAIAVSALFAPFAFWGNLPLVVLGMILWGVGMGAQESILRAGIAKMIPPERRASSYGIFNTGFGVAWFAGSSLMGFLYTRSIGLLVWFSVITQVVAIGVLLRGAARKEKA